MKFDSRWSAPNRAFFRILSFILSILCLPMGILAIAEKIKSDPIIFDSTFKFGIAAVTWGTFFLIIAIRGTLFKKRRVG